MWLHVCHLCVMAKAALSTATALYTDFPFQTVYKEKFKAAAVTQCANMTDAVRGEPNGSEPRSRFVIINHI